MLSVMVNVVGHQKNKKIKNITASSFNMAPAFASLETAVSERSQKYKNNDAKQGAPREDSMLQLREFYYVHLDSFLYLWFALF